jgi:peptidoglycan LD-endopeptidase LytH
VALLAALLFLFGGLLPAAHADTKGEIARAKARLVHLEGRIESAAGKLQTARAQTEAQEERLGVVRGEVNELATELGQEQARFDGLQQEIGLVRERIENELARYDRLRDRLDLRARLAYEQGPMGNIAFFFSASSVSDLSDAAVFMGHVARSDIQIANEVQNEANFMRMQRAELTSLAAQQARVLSSLNAQRNVLDGRFADEQEILDRLAAGEEKRRLIVAGLEADRQEVQSLLRRLEERLRAEERAAAERAAELARAAAQAEAQAEAQSGGASVQFSTASGDGPLYACPVAGPVAIADDFGAPRVGHSHQGNDMLAPLGTPVVAPFPGVVSNASNSLGGLSVYVRGSQGYVYGAHLSQFGAMGNVSTGTVIGYVGNTGNAQGGAYHLHFEWHPGSGSAVDPHAYLLEVC